MIKCVSIFGALETSASWAVAPILLYQFCTMKNKILRNLMFFSILSAPIASIASTKAEHAVNMQDGGLILKEESDSALHVSRTYRSRSLELGFFGMGWCSDLESQLIFQGKGVLRLVNCQSSRPSLFKVSDTASSYINVENPDDKILIKLGFYERKIKNVAVAKYNFKGKLIELKKNRKNFKLTYNSRSLPAKLLLNQEVVTFEWHPLLDLIEKVRSKEKVQTFTYRGFNLIKADLIQYDYDDLDNLTIRKSLKKSEQLLINYDKVSDQVLKIDGACLEKYSYQKSSPRRSLSTVSKSCQNLGLKTEFAFEYAAANNLKPTQIIVSQFPLDRLERIALNQGGEL